MLKVALNGAGSTTAFLSVVIVAEGIVKVAVSGAGRTSTFGASPSTIGVGIPNVPARTFGETVTAVETTGAGIEKVAVSGEADTSTYRSAEIVGVGILNTAVNGKV